MTPRSQMQQNPALIMPRSNRHRDPRRCLRGRRASERTNHEVTGVLRDSVVLCCASSCSGVNLQRTSRERGLIKTRTYNRQISNFCRAPSYEPGGREFESLRAHQSYSVPENPLQVLTARCCNSNSRQKTREFDNLAVFGQVGRCRAQRGGGPEGTSGAAASNLSGRTIQIDRSR